MMITFDELKLAVQHLSFEEKQILVGILIRGKKRHCNNCAYEPRKFEEKPCNECDSLYNKWEADL